MSLRMYRIDEDHVNYVLMYNMLTGIRVGVCNAMGYYMRMRNCRSYEASCAIDNRKKRKFEKNDVISVC